MIKNFLSRPVRTVIITMTSLACGLTWGTGDQKTNEPIDDVPVVFPGLDHYQDLWEKSLFTSHALPKAPAAGPSFTDALNLAGIYDIDGRTIAVVMDKASSQIVEVSTTLDKSNGMQIIEVDRGISPYKARIKIQRGSEIGWVAIPESAQGGGPAAPSILGPQSGSAPAIHAAPPAAPAPTSPPSFTPSGPPIVPLVSPATSDTSVPATSTGEAPSPPK